MPSIVTLAKLVWIAAAVVVSGDHNKPADTVAYLKNSVDACQNHCAPMLEYGHLRDPQGGDAFASSCIAECVENQSASLNPRLRQVWRDSIKDRDSYYDKQPESGSRLECVDTCYGSKFWYSGGPAYMNIKNPNTRDGLRDCLCTCKELEKDDTCQAS